MNVPVLLLIFRRPDLVERQISVLRAVRAPVLYVAADGARPGRADDLAVQAARAVIETIDWPCRVERLFRTANLGVGESVSRALDWFFEHEAAGIVLEDDCVPDPAWFAWSAALLERYADDGRVMHVSGSGFQPVPRLGDAGYYYSRYHHVWGWATWRRAWKLYRRNLEGLEAFFDEADRTEFWLNRREGVYWKKIFRQVVSGEVDSWVYRWQYTCWAENGLCIAPNGNLIRNLGFDEQATNTRDDNPLISRRGVQIPSLKAPAAMQPHHAADRWTFEQLYWEAPPLRWRHRIHKLASLVNHTAK